MNTILIVILAAACLYCFIKLMAAPIKLIFKFLLNMLSGFVILFITEIILGFFDVSIGINAVNCFIAGACGIPGVVVLLLLELLIF